MPYQRKFYHEKSRAKKAQKPPKAHQAPEPYVPRFWPEGRVFYIDSPLVVTPGSDFHDRGVARKASLSRARVSFHEAYPVRPQGTHVHWHWPLGLFVIVFVTLWWQL